MSSLTQTQTRARGRADSTLLDSARDLFMQIGLRRCSMDDIARHAGISRATLYRQFRHRPALVQAVILRECRRAMATIEQQVRHLPAIEQGRQGLFLTFHLAARHPLLQQLLKLDAESVLPLLTIDSATTLNWGQQFSTELVRYFQRQGLFPGLAAADVGELLFRLMHSWLLTPAGHVDARQEDSLHRYVDQFLWPLLNNLGNGAAVAPVKPDR